MFYGPDEHTQNQEREMVSPQRKVVGRTTEVV